MPHTQIVYFVYDSENLRIRSLGRDTAVLDTATPNMAKWVLEARRGGPMGDMWVRDAAVYLHNDKTLRDAITRLGFKPEDLLEG